MPGRNNLRIGLVGCGHWGKSVLRDLVSLESKVHVVARSPESVANANSFGCESVVSRIEDLPEIDGAVIATPTNSHSQCIFRLVSRNIPIFVEKPLTASVDEGESLRSYSNFLFVMDKWRYHPGVRKLATLAQDGTLGCLQSVQCVRWGWKSHSGDTDAVWYLAPHDLAIVMEIIGKVPDVRFAAFHDYQNAPSGGLAILGNSPWAEIHVSERREKHQRQVTVHGSLGIAILQDSYSKEIEVYHFPENDSYEKPLPERIPIGNEMPLLLELKAFLDYLCGGPPPKSNFDDAMSIVYAIHKIHSCALAQR